jgi:hypothetical protein
MKSIETFGIFDVTNVLSVATLEIYASKIVALLTRTAARDLFDISHMIVHNLFNETETVMLRKCTIFYSALGLTEPPTDIDFERVYSLTSHKIRTDLQPVLRKRDRFDLQVAQERVKTYLEAILVLEDDEQRFLDNFRAGEYMPQLLFDGDMLERVQKHPMAIWKIK